MLIGVVVHEVNTLAHPSVPPGWRWAVHAGDTWSDISTCLNAGWEPTHGQAAMAGEGAAVVGARVAGLCGAAAEVKTWTLNYDPVAAGADLITVGG